jgi:hypothetical protein
MLGRSVVNLRSRPRMHVMVFVTCAMLVLVLQWVVSATTELSAYADRRMHSAGEKVVHSQNAETSTHQPHANQRGDQ